MTKLHFPEKSVHSAIASQDITNRNLSGIRPKASTIDQSPEDARRSSSVTVIVSGFMSLLAVLSIFADYLLWVKVSGTPPLSMSTAPPLPRNTINEVQQT